MLRRKALIIECSTVPNLQHLPGAVADARAWRQYLTSNAGGAWEAEEIVTLNNPSRIVALTQVLSMDAEYGFIAFSGHGYMKDGETMVCFRDGNLSEGQLTPATGKCTVILDSCRGTFTESAALDATAHLKFAEADSEAYRALFDRALTQAEKGTSRVYGCAFTESAGETSKGGAFTQALIAAGSQSSERILGLDKAFERARATVRRRDPNQNPEYQPGRRLHHFPFAVCMD